MARAFPKFACPRPLERPNRRLTALAQRVTARATPLIPPGRACHIGMVLSADQRLHIQWWGCSDLPQAELSASARGFAPETDIEGALQHAAFALLIYLAGRWPSNAPPGILGIITDGEGLAFSAAPIGPYHAEWHPTGQELVAILPFRENRDWIHVEGNATRH